jgi:murein DD-endopeptidase MepM/ murein hydrolase activator NlpD
VASWIGRDWRPGGWNHFFRDHEILVRTDGHVRFITVRAEWQRRVATLTAALAAAWLLVTLAMVAWQAWAGARARAVAVRAEQVELAEARVAAEKRSAVAMAESLDARQDRLEALLDAHFGDASAFPASARPVPSASAPPTARLAASGVRQEQLVAAFTEAADARAAEAEAAIRAVGLQPAAVSGRGGPFLPEPAAGDPGLRRLALALARLEQLESLRAALPSGLPAERMSVTSGFGVRFDPFNGARAMHAGLDFEGAHGSPIRAAAPGVVRFVGGRPGYGNVIELDHGHGLATRYAHLSGFAVRAGERVAAGDRIGAMGSTGRSTGTHLHFEVRVNGVAVNPRRFLEAQHVQQAAGPAA